MTFAAGPPIGTRPCPYCGTWNAPEFSFCQKCGKPLPAPLAPPTAPPLAAAPPPAPVPPPSPARPLTDAERAALNRAGRGLQVAGASFGLLGLGLAVWRLASPSLSPLIYTAAAVYPAVLAVSLAYRGRLIRTGAAFALASGQARELQGLATVDARGRAAVGVGDLTVLLRPGRLGRSLTHGAQVTLVYAGLDGPQGRKPNASLLALNGSPLPRPHPCRVASALAPAPAAAKVVMALQR